MNSINFRTPAKGSEYWGNMLTVAGTRYKPCRSVLHIERQRRLTDTQKSCSSGGEVK